MAWTHNFHSIQEVQEYATQWLWTYNNDRPNMGIGGITGSVAKILGLMFAQYEASP
jgi:transposase InsO family protein